MPFPLHFGRSSHPREPVLLCHGGLSLTPPPALEKKRRGDTGTFRHPPRRASWPPPSRPVRGAVGGGQMCAGAGTTHLSPATGRGLSHAEPISSLRTGILCPMTCPSWSPAAGPHPEWNSARAHPASSAKADQPKVPKASRAPPLPARSTPEVSRGCPWCDLTPRSRH